MRDFTPYNIVNLSERARATITFGIPTLAQKASGVVTVLDYTTANSVKAAGTITFGSPVQAVKATGTITIVDYTKFAATKAQQTVTFGTPIVGDKLVVSGVTYMKVASGATGTQYTTISSLTTLLNAATGLDASDNGSIITIVAASAGVAGNSIALSLDVLNTGTMTIGGATLTGGKDADTITVNGHVLTAGSEFTAAVSNNATATSLASAIDGLALVGAAAVSAVVTVTADAFGTTANSYNLLTANVQSATVSGATMAGGINGDTVTVDGSTFTCVTGTPGANQFAVIADLTTLVNALSNVDATDNGTVVAVVAHTAGVAGNSLAMSKTGSALTLSGAVLTGGRNATTVTINGTALVAGTDWTAATSNAATATSLASAIDALANVNAAAVSGVITIHADAYGTTANSYAMLTSSSGVVSVGGATMSGGVVGDTVIINGTTCTAVSGTPGANEFKIITDLTTLADAIANIVATDDGTTVTMYADAVGTGGNAYTLALGTNAGTMAISGATFSGGDTGEYTDVINIAPEENVAVFVNISSKSGSSPTLDVTPYVSGDGSNWIAATDDAGTAITFTQFTDTGLQRKYIPHAGPFLKLKLVTGGADVVWNGTVKVVGFGATKQ